MLRTFAIALSMSADAFAASVAQGAALNRPKIVEALRMASVFGTVEMLTPVAGWLCGRAASTVVAEIDHWIAFGLLGALGAKMIWEGTTRPAHLARPDRYSLPALVATALGTSIDAFVIGLTTALIHTDIVTMALGIGAATFSMTFVGVIAGRAIGARRGRAAEAVGGLVLVAIGTAILVEHLGLWTPVGLA